MKTTEEILKQIRSLKRRVKDRVMMPHVLEIRTFDVGKMDKWSGGYLPVDKKRFKMELNASDEVLPWLFDKSLRYSIDGISFSYTNFTIDLWETHDEIDIDTWRGNIYIKGKAWVVKADTNINEQVMDELKGLLDLIWEKTLLWQWAKHARETIDDKDIFKDVDDRDIFNDPSTI